MQRGSDFAGEKLAGFPVQIGENDTAAVAGDTTRRCSAKTGGCPGDEKNAVGNLHFGLLPGPASGPGKDPL